MPETVLTGRKVKLRKLSLSDADSITRHINDKTVARWTLSVPYPYKKRDALEFIRSRRGNKKTGNKYTFGITEKDKDEVIGCIDLCDIDWEDKKAETGYWISREFRGKGYMTEAVNLILLFGFKELKLHKIYARVFKNNHASMEVLKNNGFCLEGILRREVLKYRRWIDEYYFGLLKSEYKKI